MAERDLSVDPLNPATENPFSSWPAVAAQMKLDDLAPPDDNTDLNATTARHGLLPKLLGGTTKYLREDGTWQTPAGVGSGQGVTVPIQLSPENEGLTTGLKWSGMMPFGVDVQKIVINATTASTSGSVAVTVAIEGVDVHSTPLTIDQGDRSSAAQDTPAVLALSQWGLNNFITITVTSAGVGVTGLKAWIVGVRDDTNVKYQPPAVNNTVLIDERFNEGSDGLPADTTNTSANAVTGTSSTITFDDQHTIDGGVNIYVNGTAAGSLRFNLADHTAAKEMDYITLESAASETAWFRTVYQGDDTTVAYRLGITQNGFLALQNGAAGTIVLSDSALTTLDKYRIDETVAVGGDVSLTIFTGANINKTAAASAWDVLTVAMSAPNLGRVDVGLQNTITGGGAIVSPNLANEDFEGDGTSPTDGSAILVSNTSFDTVNDASGLLDFDTGWSSGGSRSMRYAGTAVAQGIWEHLSHTTHGARGRFRFGDGPTGERWWNYQLRNGGNTATAFQAGISATNKLCVRNAASGAAIESTATLVEGTAYELTILATGATGAGSNGTVVFQAFETTNLTTPFATVTLSDMTATDFSRETIGNNSLLTTAVEGNWDNWRSSNQGVPSPIGATGSAPLKMWIDRVIRHTTTMPTPHNVLVSGVVGANLAPSTGCWWGAHVPPHGGHSGTATGYSNWRSFAGRYADALHFYKQQSWDGLFSDAEKALLTPVGQPRAIPVVNCKIRGGSSPASVLTGSADAALVRIAEGISTYPYKLILVLDHEFDTSSTTVDQLAEWASMFRYAVDILRANNRGNMLIGWCPVGYSGNVGTNGSKYNAMWPGDDKVDWPGWDPYYQTSARQDFGHYTTAGGVPRSLINENVAGVTGWSGMYNWLTTPKTVGVNNLAYTFAGNKPLAIYEWGTWYERQDDPPPPSNIPNPDPTADLTDAMAADRIESIGEQIRDFPALKLIMHYNDNLNHFNHIDVDVPSKTLSKAAFAAVGALSYFNVGTQNAS